MDQQPFKTQQTQVLLIDPPHSQRGSPGQSSVQTCVRRHTKRQQKKSTHQLRGKTFSLLEEYKRGELRASKLLKVCGRVFSTVYVLILVSNFPVFKFGVW